MSHAFFMDEFWKDVRELSLDLEIKPETSRKWQTRRAIPTRWHHPLIMAAQDSGKDLTWDRLMEPPALELESK